MVPGHLGWFQPLTRRDRPGRARRCILERPSTESCSATTQMRPKETHAPGMVDRVGVVDDEIHLQHPGGGLSRTSNPTKRTDVNTEGAEEEPSLRRSPRAARSRLDPSNPVTKTGQENLLKKTLQVGRDTAACRTFARSTLGLPVQSIVRAPRMRRETFYLRARGPRTIPAGTTPSRARRAASSVGVTRSRRRPNRCGLRLR